MALLARNFFANPIFRAISHENLTIKLTRGPVVVIWVNNRQHLCAFHRNNTEEPRKNRGLKWSVIGIFSALLGSVTLFLSSIDDDQQNRPKSSAFHKIYELLSYPIGVQAATPIVIDAEPNNAGSFATAAVLSRSQKFNFIADVVEKIAPAVVYLEILGRHPLFGNTIPISNGSGFIVREDGLILTNAHVVANRASVVVKLYDGRIFNGSVEDIDPISDLATVRIQCHNLPILRLGCSDKLRPGEWVVAMGSPLTLSNTITSGVISSVHRESKELGIHHKNMDYIQTDASINFGNSGGPLVNLDGEAIGINTMKVTAGISFAIPADYAHDFLKRTEEKQKDTWSWFGKSASHPQFPKRRYMGITMLGLSPNLILEMQQRQPDFPEDVIHGVMVWKVVIGSPAYKGGLQPGDIITHINGKAVKSTVDVNKALESNHDLNMSVVRKHQHMALTVVPED